MRINKDMRQKKKRRLNKMGQWWLGTAPSGLELAGEADSPAKVYILQSKKSCSKSCITIVLLYQHVCRSTINACRVLSIGTGVHDTMQDRGQCNMHASLYYEYGMMLCINTSCLFYSSSKLTNLCLLRSGCIGILLMYPFY